MENSNRNHEEGAKFPAIPINYNFNSILSLEFIPGLEKILQRDAQVEDVRIVTF